MFLDSHLIKFIAWKELPCCLQGNWKHKIIIYVQQKSLQLSLLEHFLYNITISLLTKRKNM